MIQESMAGLSPLSILLVLSIVWVVTAQESKLCRDLNTPHIPPQGVTDKAGYGAPCKNRPCQAGMTCCENSQRKLVCEDVDECSSDLLNNCTQICDNQYGSYSCSCDKDFSLLGDRVTCQPIINPVAGSPCDDVRCSDHGSCIEELGGDVLCICEGGWTGGQCSENVDDCSAEICSNGGTCTDEVNGFSCSCNPDWTGVTCGQDVLECNMTACSGNGQCIERAGGGVVCLCDPGFRGDSCEEDVDDCRYEPCLNNGTCKDGVENFTCTCVPPWTGNKCETNMCQGAFSAYNPVDNTCVRAVLTKKSYTDAKDYCEFAGEHLGVFPTQESLLWLKRYRDGTGVMSEFMLGLVKEASGWRWDGRITDVVLPNAQLPPNDQLWVAGYPSSTGQCGGSVFENVPGLYTVECQDYNYYFLCEQIL